MKAYSSWENQKEEYRWMYRGDPENRSIVEQRKTKMLDEFEYGLHPLRGLGKGFLMLVILMFAACILTGAFPQILSGFLAGFTSNKLLSGIVIGLVAFLFTYIRKRDAHDIEEMEVRNSTECPGQESRTFRA